MTTLSVTEIERRVKLARDLLAAIPAPQLNLNNWYSGYLTEQQLSPTTPHCGTIACAAGHLAMTPEFMELGLFRNNICGGIYFSSTYALEPVETGFNALAQVFGFISLAEALFCSPHVGKYDSYIFANKDLPNGRVHKSLVLERMGHFLNNIVPNWKIDESQLDKI